MNQLLLTTSKGLEELLQKEVETLCPDAKTRIRPGQVRLDAELADAYRLCLWSRLANRVLWVLTEGPANDKDQLYQLASSVQWGHHFDCNGDIVVDFIGTNREIRHSQFGALVVKDAIVDQTMELFEQRPNINKVDPDVRIQCRLWRDKAILAIDLSGQSLHLRHYRQQTGDAPLKEHVACAILYRSGWVGSGRPLLDPMCGSGTLMIEAALMAANIAPGLSRQRWGFDQWRGHQDTVWQSLKDHAIAQQIEPSMPLEGCDADSQVIGFARANAKAAGVEQWVTFQRADVSEYRPEHEQVGYVVCNPPYGERLGELTALLPLYDRWGQHLKAEFKGWHLAIITSNRDLLRQLKLRASKDYTLYNGKLECQLALFEMNEANCQVHSQNSDFKNRLSKNLSKLQRWIKQQNTNAYRVYDADLPEYNIAIDRYNDWVVVQEYAPPKAIPESKARRRLMDAVMVIPEVMGIDPDHLVLKVRRRQKGKEQYDKFARDNEFMTIVENGAQYRVNLKDYLDTGVFLDHRDTRQLMQTKSRHKDVLNLFCYTATVSVQAAMGGARSVTSVDMSKTYLEWAERNFALNRLKGSQYRFLRDDCTKFLRQHSRQYDLIFIDPPSFSNSKRMEDTWDVQRDHVRLLTDAKACLKPEGEIVFSNNLRQFKLDEKALEAVGLVAENITSKTIPEDFKRHANIHQCWILRHA